MTTQDQIDLDVWLDEARRGLSPRDADRARVLTALEQQLNLPPQAPQASQTSQTSQTSIDQLNQLPTESAAATQVATRTLLQWAARVLLPVAGISAVAVIATQLSTKDAAPSGKPAKPVAAVVVTEAPATPVATADETQTPAQTQPAEDKLPAPKKKPQRKKCRTSAGQERPCKVEASETALAVAEPELAAPPPTAAASLRKELEALRQAQQSLRNGQAAQALAVLEAFEREAAAAGEMKEERNAAATMARCALAQTDKDKSSELYRAFVQQYPQSAYAARLRRTCSQP